jgi:hypothetical protein
MLAGIDLFAGLFNPPRWRMQGLIDKRFYRSKCDADKTLAALSRKEAKL